MQIKVADKIIQVTPSKRNKRMRMRVVPPNGEIKVSCPIRTTTKEVERFVISNLDWIERATKKVMVNEEEKSYLQGGNNFVLFGKKYEIVEVESKNYSLVLGNDKCILGCPKTATREQKCEFIKAMMKNVAKKEIPPRVARFEQILGVKCSGISYKFTTSRWGSCNHKTKKVNFSVYAVQKPIEYLDYLVCHELLHIIYPNHGIGFKTHLKRIIPNADVVSKLK